MNLLGINNLAYLGREAYAQAKNLKGTEGEDKETAGGSPDQAKQPTQAQQIHATERIRKEVLQEYHGLNPQSARQTLEQVSQYIAQAPPWRLMETQPVAERNLVPAAYV